MKIQKCIKHKKKKTLVSGVGDNTELYICDWARVESRIQIFELKPLSVNIVPRFTDERNIKWSQLFRKKKTKTDRPPALKSVYF